MNKRILQGVVVAFAGTLLGCSNSDMAPVSGIVTLDGKPVDKATVIFQIQPEGRPVSWAVTDEQGRFKLSTEDDEPRPGARLGTHVVMVRKLEVLGVKATDDGLSGFTAPNAYEEVWHTPKKYGSVEKSPLRFEVKQGANEATLELKSDPVLTE